MSWSSPKTDLVFKSFLNVPNRIFENVSFSQQQLIPLLNNLFISFLNLFISLTELKPFLNLITYLFIFLNYFFSLTELKNIH